MLKLEDYRKAWRLMKPRERRASVWSLLALAIAALFAAIMVGSVLPFLVVMSEPQKIHDNAYLSLAYSYFGFSSDYSFLMALGIVSIAIIVISNLIQVLRVFVIARLSTRLLHSLSERLLVAYLAQPYTFFLQKHSSDLATQVLAETQQVVNLFFRPLAEVIAATFTVIAITSLLLWTHPVVTMAAVGGLGLIYGIVLFLTRQYVRRLGDRRQKANSGRFRTAQEALTGIKDIKLLGREWAYANAYSKDSRIMTDSMYRVQLVSQMPQFAMQALALSGIILICIVLLTPISLEQGNALGGILPIIGLFAFAGQRLLPELSKLYQYLVKLAYAGAAVDTCHKDLTQLGNHAPLPKVLPVPHGLKTELLLEKVSYSYPGANKQGLEDINLRIQAGERIGIVGATGSGKTTLANLVLGVIRPDSGRLLADGTLITDGNMRAWQQTLGYVPQDIFLGNSSIAQNIALGVPEHKIDLAKIRHAAEIAQLDHFVTKELSKGYETEIGERGIRLSGGQRQRIGIARALYHDADLIVLDEATSALDNLTEREVMMSIDALPGDKTLIMIAHRLSTLQNCDRILVLEKGKVEACGRWDDLLKTSAGFNRIARSSNEMTKNDSLEMISGKIS